MERSRPPLRGSLPCLRAFPIAVAALLAAACASVAPPAGMVPPASSPAPANREPPPPNVNLSGFPLPYRQGYADGCASVSGPERKDAARFSSDTNYRMGWQDGAALCKKR